MKIYIIKFEKTANWGTNYGRSETRRHHAIITAEYLAEALKMLNVLYRTAKISKIKIVADFELKEETKKLIMLSEEISDLIDYEKYEKEDNKEKERIKKYQESKKTEKSDGSDRCLDDENPGGFYSGGFGNRGW